MSDAKLIIEGAGKSFKTILKPVGTTIGRDAGCDIVLDHKSVSRKHARVFQDPFGRWIIEDLGSSNGVIVDGNPVKAHAISPGHKILISVFALMLDDESAGQLSRRKSMPETIAVVDSGADESIVSHKAGKPVILSPDLMKHMNEFTACLMKLDSPADLYYSACRDLAEMLHTLVAIVRLPGGDAPIPDSPDIIACHFGDEMGGDVLQRTNLNFSRRVLEAIRTSEATIMASSGPSSGQDMMLTIIDDFKPHLVFAARVNDLGDTVDALYLDILESKSPLELFDFVEASARQINFVQKNLLFIELERKEKELREANAQLQEKDRIKDEYVSRVTHDIKGHLAAIQSCLWVAGAESSGPLNEKQSDFLGRAVKRNEQLTAFVKELLNLTQMRLSGQQVMDEFSLPGSIAEALETVGRKAEDKSITLTSKIDPGVGTILGDRFSINEMITNLLFNAIKYTPDGKTVHLEAAIDGDMVRLDFVDTGIGIPEGEVEKVFEEFFRATNAKNSKKEGTGLGLSLVKQIIERHGGNITVRSKEGEGSTFTVMLPQR